MLYIVESTMMFEVKWVKHLNNGYRLTIVQLN